MLLNNVFTAAAVLLSSFVAARAPLAPDFPLVPRQLCNGTIVLDTSTQQYVIKEGDTLTKIGQRFNRGICDIAAANNIKNPDYILTGDTITIPPQVCFPDNTSCLAPKITPTATCILGGPGFYQVRRGDTLFQLSRLYNITLDSIIQANRQNVPNPDLIEVGQIINIPVCEGSLCQISPYCIQQGDIFVNLAKEFGSSAGQILALNPQAEPTKLEPGQVITLPSRCGVFPGYPGHGQGNQTKTCGCKFGGSGTGGHRVSGY